ncbi:MAG: porin [Cypionkella sp.]
MKKILLATTVLVGFAGAASADVTVSGYGRFGLDYYSLPGAGFSKTVVSSRLRFNIDAKMTTDGGVTFGGRVRLQSDANDSSNRLDIDPITGAPSSTAISQPSLSPAMLYATANGMRLEVGNANTAFDSAALFYDSEMGFTSSSAGEGAGDFYAFSTDPYAADRMGVFFSYSSGPLNARISYINPSQSLDNLPTGVAAEGGISVDYKFGQFTVSVAGVQNGSGKDGNDQTFVGVAYALSDVANIGLNYYDQQDVYGNTTTLYGNYVMNAITLRGYITNNDLDTNKNKTIVGVGADYDLGGGAMISGSIRPDFAGETNADIGVKFNF